jgi:predicted DNA-binding transcriptional regulator AlpA
VTAAGYDTLIYGAEEIMTIGQANHDGDSRLFLSATEIGHKLGLQKSRVYALAAEGLLPTVRLGRRIWFPRRGLEVLASAAIERVEERLARPTHLSE